MPRRPVSCAFVVVASSLAVAAGQPAPTGSLSEALRAHLKDERFDVVTSIRGLPLGVRDELQTMWRSQTLDIAEPGAEYQETAGANRPLPSRRLVAAGCSADHHCLVSYQRSGRSRAWVVTLFQWTPAATRFDGGGTVPGGLKTIEEVRKAILSGRNQAD